MILLDTNVISEPMRPRPDPRVLAWLDDQVAGTLFLSTITLSELLLGVESLPAGRRRKALTAVLEDHILPMFADLLLPFDVAAARAYPGVVMRARRQGYPIAVADAAIASIAECHHFTMATRDEAPFRAAGLFVINPWTASGESKPRQGP